MMLIYLQFAKYDLHQLAIVATNGRTPGSSPPPPGSLGRNSLLMHVWQAVGDGRGNQQNASVCSAAHNRTTLVHKPCPPAPPRHRVCELNMMMRRRRGNFN